MCEESKIGTGAPSIYVITQIWFEYFESIGNPQFNE